MPGSVHQKGTPVPHDVTTMAHIEEAVTARMAAEEASQRLQSAIIQATAAASEARARAHRATAVAMITGEAIARTRQVLEIQATGQALSTLATRQHLEVMATATAQTLSAEATRRSIEATREWDRVQVEAHATALAYGRMPTATAISRVRVLEERERQARWIFTLCLYSLALIGTASAVFVVIRGVHRLLEAWAVRARVVHGQGGQIYVVHVPDWGGPKWPELPGASTPPGPAADEALRDHVLETPAEAEPVSPEGSPGGATGSSPSDDEPARTPEETGDGTRVLILDGPKAVGTDHLVRLAEEVAVLEGSAGPGGEKASTGEPPVEASIHQALAWRMVRITSQVLSRRGLDFPFHRAVAATGWVFLLLDPRRMRRIDLYKNFDLMEHLRISIGRPVYALPSVRFRGDWFGYAICLKRTPALPEQAEFPGLEPGVIRLGIGLGGEVRLAADQLSHYLIAGDSQLGKTNFLRLFAVQAVALGMRIEVVDPRQHLLMGLEHPGLREWRPEETEDLFEELHGEMRRRDALLKEHRAENIRKLNEILRERGLPVLPRVLVVMDELEAIQVILSVERGAMRRFWQGLVGLVLQSMRDGIHFVVAAHLPTREMLGMLKDVFPGRFAFRLPSEAISRVWLGRAGAERLRVPGRVMSPDFGVFQSYRMDVSAAESILWRAESSLGAMVSAEDARVLAELAADGGKVTLFELMRRGHPERRARAMIRRWRDAGVLKKHKKDRNAHYIDGEVMKTLGFQIPPNHPDFNGEVVVESEKTTGKAADGLDRTSVREDAGFRERAGTSADMASAREA